MLLLLSCVKIIRTVRFPSTFSARVVVVVCFYRGPFLCCRSRRHSLSSCCACVNVLFSHPSTGTFPSYGRRRLCGAAVDVIVFVCVFCTRAIIRRPMDVGGLLHPVTVCNLSQCRVFNIFWLSITNRSEKTNSFYKKIIKTIFPNRGVFDCSLFIN